MFIHLRYAGEDYPRTIFRPIITIISEFSYDAIVDAVTKSFPYQDFVSRSPLVVVKCVGFNFGAIFFSCPLTMAVAMPRPRRETILEMVVVDAVEV